MQQHTAGASTPKLILSPTEAAQALSMSKSKLYGLWRDDPANAPPFLTIGKNRYIRVAALDKWLADREKKPT